MPDALGRLLSSVAGKRVPGGCDQCEAEQVLEEVGTGVWVMTVIHDDGCTFYRCHVGRVGVN